MTPLVHIAMFGFIPFALAMFGRFPPRRAAAIVFAAGWMFLPQAKFDFPILPDYTKGNAIGIATLIAMSAKDPGALSRFRLSWLDLPILCWSLAPFFSSITNGLGPWDGLSASLSIVFEWGLPILIGRIYFGSLDGLRELATVLFIGGLILAPLAVLEMIISPQLHIKLYGWYPHDFSQTKRGGGYRPSLFMEHGLELAMWTAAAAFMGWQLLLSGHPKGRIPVLNLPLMPSAAALTVVLALSRSMGALMLFFLALAASKTAVILKNRLPIFVLLCLPVLYMSLRASGRWDGAALINAAAKISGSDQRTGSLSFRIHNETLLAQKALIRPAFGWAGYKRSFVTNSKGQFISVPDGRWILVLGRNGIFGLISVCATVLLPPLLFLLRIPPKALGSPHMIPATAFSTFLAIIMIDDLFNAMFNPIMLLAAGGLSSLVLSGFPAVEESTPASACPTDPTPALPRVF